MPRRISGDTLGYYMVYGDYEPTYQASLTTPGWSCLVDGFLEAADPVLCGAV